MARRVTGERAADGLVAYVGDDLLNLMVRIAYETRREAFRGKGGARGFAYAFDVAAVPVVRLVDGAPDHDVEVDLPTVAVEVRGGFVAAARTLTMQARGTLTLRDGAPSITRLGVTTTSAGLVDRVIVGVVDAQIKPRIAAALAGLRVPDLARAFGGDPALGLRTLEVRPGPVLALGAGFVDETGIAPADPPSDADLAPLRLGEPGRALALLVVSADAVNRIVSARVPPISHAFDRRRDARRVGAGVRGTVAATTPVLAVCDGRGSARMRVTFEGLAGGVRVPVGGWTWLPLHAPATDVVVEHDLIVSEGRVVLRLTSVEALVVPLDWPRLLKPVERVVRALLQGVLRRIHGRARRAVEGREIALFDVPTALAGAPEGVEADVVPGGLGYRDGSLRAVLRVRFAAAGG